MDSVIVGRDVHVHVALNLAVLWQCGNSGEWKLCMSLMDRMRSEGITPNAYSFSPLIKACGKVRRERRLVLFMRGLCDGGETDANTHIETMADVLGKLRTRHLFVITRAPTNRRNSFPPGFLFCQQEKAATQSYTLHDAVL